jgi:hypothetical protein
MGDGVLISFGYPQAHEDNAERAVRSGLALIEAVGKLAGVEPLQVRIGQARSFGATANKGWARRELGIEVGGRGARQEDDAAWQTTWALAYSPRRGASASGHFCRLTAAVSAAVPIALPSPPL